MEREGTGLTSTHSTLHDYNILGLPNVQNRHSGDRRSRLERDRVYRIICPNNQDDVSLGEVVVDLVHLEHDYEISIHRLRSTSIPLID